MDVSGRPANLFRNAGSSANKKVKMKTGLDIKIKNIIFAKTYPEKPEFLSIYYLCENLGGKEAAGEKFMEVKWIKPSDVTRYFTTSLHPKLFEYLRSLE